MEKENNKEELESLELKWGTLKGWGFVQDSPAHQLMKEYAKHGMSMSAMMQKDTPEQKEILCKMIDAVQCKKIYLDWDGKYVSKKKAKEYVMNN